MSIRLIQKDYGRDYFAGMTSGECAVRRLKRSFQFTIDQSSQHRVPIYNTFIKSVKYPSLHRCGTSKYREVMST